MCVNQTNRTVWYFRTKRTGSATCAVDFEVRKRKSSVYACAVENCRANFDSVTGGAARRSDLVAWLSDRRTATSRVSGRFDNHTHHLIIPIIEANEFLLHGCATILVAAITVVMASEADTKK